MQVLVTGSTGYIGGRLVPRLLDAGYTVRVMTRDPHRLEGRLWFNKVEVMFGDVTQPETLPQALQGAKIAYYLINSLINDPETQEKEFTSARDFGKAAAEAGIEWIIYLDWLGDSLSMPTRENQASKQIGDGLRTAGIPVTQFQAAVLIGSGSISFEIIRYLSERLPVMFCPKWIFTKVQPIGIADTLSYLIEVLKVPESKGKIIQIGADDILSYGEMIKGYATARGLKRILIPLPVYAQKLSTFWVHWVTPIPVALARSLISGLKEELIVDTTIARSLFPQIKPINYRTALGRALDRIDEGRVESIWSDALTSSQGAFQPVELVEEEGMMVERRLNIVATAPENVFKTYSSLGGKRGWLVYNFAWQLRGAMDRMVGGVGMRRGRRHPVEIRVGEAIDFWRVEAVEAGRVLRLRAEMKMPGKGWLQFESIPLPGGWTLLVQTAFFNPKGIFGLIYWFLLYPFHALIFAKLVRKIAEITEAELSPAKPAVLPVQH